MRASVLLLCLFWSLTANAQVPQSALPQWRSEHLPFDNSPYGVRVTFQVTATSATVVLRTRTVPVQNASEVASVLDGELRGYRRRYGMRRTEDGSYEHGGTEPMETLLEAPGSLPLSRLMFFIAPHAYASWNHRVSLRVRLENGSVAELPVSFVRASPNDTTAVNASTTLDALLRSLAAGPARTQRLRIVVG